ncbi:MAG TPA: FUSC family protein [Methylomirabilota bacterium]|nr:FUSC family protein [Methylomirabilota bacterium]
MMRLAEARRPPRWALLPFLRDELSPRPGRLAAVARISTCCTLVVAIGMLFQIPLTGYMAYAVYLIGCREMGSTLKVGIAAALAFSIAVAVSLMFYALDASEPALRLPLMAASTFIAIYLTRTMTLGPVAFLAGFVLVLSQTLIDEFPTLEALTRFVLWLWVVIMVPVAVTVLVNLLIGETPSGLARQTALRLLATLAAALRQGEAVPLRRAEAEAVELLELRQHAGMLDPSLRGRTAIDTMLIETLAELLALCRGLPPETPVAARLPLAQACEACAAAFERDEAPASWSTAAIDIEALSPAARPVIVAMNTAMARLSDGLARRPTASGPPAAHQVKTLLVADAFTNPAYARFALKTTLAVMAAYIIYSGLDWHGISTSITTCFFVALGSLGETIHKGTLRIAGALVGGLIGGLCVVYVLPEMTDIGQLCLLIAAAAALGGWVATGTDLLAYAGMQGAFAFFLTVLQGYGPDTDLTAPRDRVVGILLGNLLMTLVFSLLWPTSAVDRARSSLATALRTLGRLLTDETTGKPGSRLAVIRALGEARRFVTLAAFELRMLPARAWLERTGGVSLDALDRVAAAAFVVVDQEPPPAIAEAMRPHDQAIAAWLLACADRVAPGGLGAATALEPPPPDDVLVPVADDAGSVRASIEARELLRAEIEHAIVAPA